jgi:hypothetical protein
LRLPTEFCSGDLRITMACHIKGQAFNGLLVALTQLKGPESKKALLPLLGPDLRLLVEKDAVMAAGWYPLSAYSELAKGISSLCGGNQGLELGRLGMRNDINAVARWLLSLASPLMLVKLSANLMRMYFKDAKLEVSQSGGNEGTLIFSQMDGSCEATYDAIGGAVAAFVEVSGGKDVRLRIAAGGGTETTVTYVVSWG